jgi:hypothetical protein
MPQLRTSSAMTNEGIEILTLVSPSISSALIYKSVSINDINIFYRDAGPRDAPAGHTENRQWPC